MVYPFQILGDHFNYNVGGASGCRVSGSGVESEATGLVGGRAGIHSMQGFPLVIYTVGFKMMRENFHIKVLKIHQK